MADLSHWNIADNFSAIDVAALTLGIEPGLAEPHKLSPLLMRLERSFRLSCEWNYSVYRDELRAHEMDHAGLRSQMLESVALKDVQDDLAGGVIAVEQFIAAVKILAAKFDTQRFDRGEVSRWLAVHAVDSRYPFALEHACGESLAPGGADEPEGRPMELDIANITFRAISTNYGAPSATLKNRAMAYLRENYPALSQEAVQRIATVVNPDKAPGRRKKDD
ncbi:MAG: hypothetical protein AAB403_01450 [Planctomycetota bacterium]